MGGFHVPAQPFSIYQAIDWLCSTSATLANEINATKRVREMLENGKADDLVKLGIVSRLAELLERTHEVDLQSEIIWSLANIAAGKSAHTKLVLRKCLHKFIDLLDENCIDEIKNDIVWALSNIAGDSVECRDELINAGILNNIVAMLNSSQRGNVEKNCVWFLSNIFRHHKNPLSVETIGPCMPILARYLKHSNPEILCNACWSLKYLASGTTQHVDAVIDTGICKPLVALIDCKKVVNCALLVAINILSGTNRQTDALVACGIVPAFVKLLERDNEPNVVKNVCFALSNIAASNGKHIEALLKSGVYTKLIEIHGSSCHSSIKTEILHVLSNTLCNNNFNNNFREMLGTAYLDVLLATLSSGDGYAINIALQTLACSCKGLRTFPRHAYFVFKNLLGHHEPKIANLAQAVINVVKFD